MSSKKEEQQQIKNTDTVAIVKVTRGKKDFKLIEWETTCISSTVVTVLNKLYTRYLGFVSIFILPTF